jgi:hypothetical protein
VHDKLQAALDSLLPKLPRSRLKPYREFIHECAGVARPTVKSRTCLGRTASFRYGRARCTIFVRTHLQAKGKRKRAPAGPLGISIAEPTTSKVVSHGAQPEGVSSLRQRVATLKRRQAPTEMSATIFHYEPNEPLRLKPGQGAKGV